MMTTLDLSNYRGTFKQIANWTNMRIKNDYNPEHINVNENIRISIVTEGGGQSHPNALIPKLS